VPTVDGHKTYRLWDVYPHADFVTYPSIYEGFGNALLEAMYFRKPLLVNRYSIYARDIAPCGFRVVEMDGVLTRGAVDEVELLLGDAGVREEWAEHNYQLCLHHYSYELLERHLGDILLELYGT
jgi:mannosylglucosylglycerate synthase